MTDATRPPTGPASAGADDHVRELARELGIEAEALTAALARRNLVLADLAAPREQWPRPLHDLYVAGALDSECVLLGRSGMGHAMRNLGISGGACGVGAWGGSDVARLLAELVTAQPITRRR